MTKMLFLSFYRAFTGESKTNWQFNNKNTCSAERKDVKRTQKGRKKDAKRRKKDAKGRKKDVT